ncbi:MAG: phosphohistidine phosphatase SixA [Polyangiaceae bacterium]
MKLYVMRHGPAEDDSASGRDEDRALTPSGRRRVHDVAKLLVHEHEMPARILTSRLVRAQQTAEIVLAAAAKGVHGWKGELETVKELAPGGKGLDLVHGLLAADSPSVMVVGHEPDLSKLVGELLGHPMPVPMDKAMVVALKLHEGHPAKLRFIVEPRSPEVVRDHR